jgi:hypothetical protein
LAWAQDRKYGPLPEDVVSVVVVRCVDVRFSAVVVAVVVVVCGTAGRVVVAAVGRRVRGTATPTPAPNPAPAATPSVEGVALGVALAVGYALVVDSDAVDHVGSVGTGGSPLPHPASSTTRADTTTSEGTDGFTRP